VTLPLDGVRVVEYAQYVAGPLCGVLLADLGAEVVKVEPPTGDGYRHVLPAAPGVGRYFVPLNRGKRSVVVDLKTGEGLATSASLLASADVVVHNFPPERAARFGLAWEDVNPGHPALVVGRVTSYGTSGPLAGAPAYDLVAQARAGLLTAHASPCDTVPVRAGGIPMADLTAGFLLASGVLAALVRARETGIGELVDVSLLAAALAVQLQDLVWLPGEAQGNDVAVADRAHLGARASEIASGVAMNPYYRCFEASDGFIAVACLNVAQRPAFLGPVRARRPDDRRPGSRAGRPGGARGEGGRSPPRSRTRSRAPVAEWLERLEAAACRVAGSSSARRSTRIRRSCARHSSPRSSRRASGRFGCSRRSSASAGDAGAAAPAPSLGADTDAVLAELR
jgi:crotonobetainyl-CoA:carnitine CoA-transferase CaiB-like acyl-CoA transferase